MTATIETTLTLTLADGETRAAELCTVGPQDAEGFLCPFCRYPSTNRTPVCDNPWCDTHLDAARLDARREEQAARAAEEARRKRDHEWAMQRIAEDRARRDAQWDVLRVQAEENGQCVRCLRHSYWETRPKFVRHRDPANCPQVRS